MALLLHVLCHTTANDPTSSESSTPRCRPEPHGGCDGQPQKEAIIPPRPAIRREVDVDACDGISGKGGVDDSDFGAESSKSIGAIERDRQVEGEITSGKGAVRGIVRVVWRWQCGRKQRVAQPCGGRKDTYAGSGRGREERRYSELAGLLEADPAYRACSCYCHTLLFPARSLQSDSFVTRYGRRHSSLAWTLRLPIRGWRIHSLH